MTERITKQMEREIIDCLDEGMTQQELLDHYHISYATMVKINKRRTGGTLPGGARVGAGRKLHEKNT
jgi:transposase